jgi:hypothetical protein
MKFFHREAGLEDFFPRLKLLLSRNPLPEVSQ